MKKTNFSSRQSPTDDRLIQLDALRGLAVLMVLGYHYTTMYQELYGHPTHLLFQFSSGLYGVNLFFIISGFVIFMTLHRTSEYKDFIVSRIARLYPTYWLAVLLTYSTVLIFSLPGRETTFFDAILNLSMLEQWLKVPYVDGAYWTLSLELSFYMIMTLLFIFKRMKQIESVSLIWLSLMVVLKEIEHISRLQFGSILKTSLLLDYANLFCAGIMFYKIYRQESSKKTNIIILLSLAIEFLERGPHSGIICAIFFMVFYGITLRSEFINKALSFKPLVYVGTISYSLYLIHQNIGYVLLRALYKRNFLSIYAIGVATSLSFLLAVLMNRIIEKPMRETIRSIWKDFKLKKKLIMVSELQDN